MDRGPGNASGAAPRRGRIRPGENEPPPLWLGVVFVLTGAATMALGLGTARRLDLTLLMVLGIGLLFASGGVGMTLTTLRAARGRVAVTAAGQRGPVDVFTRSPMRILVDLVLAPLGAFGFLGFAVASLALGPMALISVPIFGFFGFIMLSGAAVTMRRGVRRAVAEVGPDGIWTPELPHRLAWAEIDRLEVEDAVGTAGEQGLVVYRRLGIWPREASLAERAPGRRAMGPARFFLRLINSLRPSAGLSDPSRMAPFGIQAYEIEQDFGELLRSAERYAEIVGVTRGEEETAARRLLPPAPPLDGLPGAIAANLAPQAGYDPAIPGSLVGAAPGATTSLAVVSSAAGPEGVEPLVFARRSGGPAVLGLLPSARAAVFMVVFPVVWFGLPLIAGVPPWDHDPLFLAFGLIPLLFLVLGIVSLLELPGRWRLLRGDPRLATVDDRGIEMRGMGRLAWGQVAEARVVTSSMPVQEGRPAARRLEIVPLDPVRLAARPWSDRAYDRLRGLIGRINVLGRGSDRSPGAFGLDLDLLEDPEGLLDAVARYRLVDERGRD